jgi:hypothetical protein
MSMRGVVDRRLIVASRLSMLGGCRDFGQAGRTRTTAAIARQIGLKSPTRFEEAVARHQYGRKAGAAFFAVSAPPWASGRLSRNSGKDASV